MFGYSRQAARKSAVFEMMFWFASRMTSLDLGLLCLRYHATWQARSYGPGGQRYAAGGILRTNTPPSGMARSCSASAWVCGPAFHACSTLSWFSARPSTSSHWNSTPGATTARSYSR